MNKGRRNELTMLKYKKRLKNLGLKESEGKFYCYKSTGNPCSCPLCTSEKYKRAEKHKKTITEIETEFDENFDNNENIIDYLDLDNIERKDKEE